MPGERIELSRAEARGILSPLRLPISPPRQFEYDFVYLYYYYLDVNFFLYFFKLD